ncbi:MAG: PTS transporter subunit EIIA [bacterium]|nr:PTS transporter subunit EIIA [bacterium]
MKLTDILSRSCVLVPIKAPDKTGAIAELVDLLAETGRISDREQVLKAVLEREQTRSTGIGYGLAVPHGKSAACPSLAIAVGKPVEPIDFGSRDGEPANILVLLASPPDQTGPHIQALARISRLMLIEKFRQALADAATADDLWEVISRHEG